MYKEEKPEIELLRRVATSSFPSCNVLIAKLTLANVKIDRGSSELVCRQYLLSTPDFPNWVSPRQGDYLLM